VAEIVIGATVGALVTLVVVVGTSFVLWRHEARLLDQALAEIAGLT
jgi:hypothetical protein